MTSVMAPRVDMHCMASSYGGMTGEPLASRDE